MFNVGIIGLGQISRTHLGNFSNIPDVQVAAISDLSEERIQKCVEKYPVEQIFQDYHELLALKDLNLVVVCLPPTSGFWVTLRCHGHTPEVHWLPKNQETEYGTGATVSPGGDCPARGGGM